MMKMNWKKTVGMLAGMAVLGAALTGCGNSAGGATGAISVVSREDGSGTRGAFVELCGVEDADGNAVVYSLDGKRRIPVRQGINIIKNKNITKKYIQQ